MKSSDQHLWDSGLLWLINAAILHPRGYALAAIFDDDEPQNVIGYTVIGDGSEPWCFEQVHTDSRGLPYHDHVARFQSDSAYRRFALSEIERERVWSEKLQLSQWVEE